MARDNNDGTITVDKIEYEAMEDAAQRYWSLRNNGVDNWAWFWEALVDYRAWKGEDDE